MIENNKNNSNQSANSDKTKICPTVVSDKEEAVDLPDQNQEDDFDIDQIKLPKAKKRYGNSAVSAFIKTCVYIAVVLVISIVLAMNIIFVANDVFAFRKPDAEITVTLEDYPDINSIADVLAEKDVIKYPAVFKLYARFKKKDSYNFAPGTYTVNSSMNYDDLIITFVPEKSARRQVSITIPEGSGVDEIIDIFVENGIGDRDKFIDVINEYDFDYWFLKDLECSEDRIYRLEGYLYPDTYYFWSDSSEVTAINKLLNNFNKKIQKKWLTRCEEIGFTLDQVLTLASIIEEEAKYPEDYTKVSSVFHNRLVSEEFKGLLQSDATTQYFYRHVYGMKKAPFTDEDRKFDCPYSTYLYNGLPPSPLSTPSIESIGSVLYPEETNYYYFITDIEGRCMFAVTFEEHNRNIAIVEAEKNSAANGGNDDGGNGQ